MHKDKYISYFALSGILAVVFYVLHDVIGSLNYPGYDWLSQAVSDLTAASAPSRLIAGGLSAVYGTLSVLAWVLITLFFIDKVNKTFRIGIYLFTIMSIISAIGYSLFPLSEAGLPTTFQDIMHIYVVTISVVLLSIISLIFLGIGANRSQQHRFVGIAAIVTLVFMMMGAIGSMAVPASIFGLFERFSTYAAVMFTGAMGAYVFIFTNFNKKSLLN